MLKLIDTKCTECGKVLVDQWDDEEILCPDCGTPMEHITVKNNRQRAFVNDARTIV